MKKGRKKLIYMDLSAVEQGTHLSKFEQLTRERMASLADWDKLIFWLDLDASLECLNDYERDCFVANLLEGYTKKEISKKYRVTPQAILKQIKKAKRKIKEFLKEGYETP